MANVCLKGFWRGIPGVLALALLGPAAPAALLAPLAYQELAPQPVTPRDGVYKGPVDAATDTLTFLPYGCTELRVVALPVVP